MDPTKLKKANELSDFFQAKNRKKSPIKKFVRKPAERTNKDSSRLIPEKTLISPYNPVKENLKQGLYAFPSNSRESK